MERNMERNMEWNECMDHFCACVGVTFDLYITSSLRCTPSDVNFVGGKV